MCRVAEAYETLKPQLPHSAPSTPCNAKESQQASYCSHSAASSVVAVAPLQDASNRKLTAPRAKPCVPPLDPEQKIAAYRDFPHSHSRVSRTSSSLSQERPASAAAVHCEPRMHNMHDVQAAPVLPAESAPSTVAAARASAPNPTTSLTRDSTGSASAGAQAIACTTNEMRSELAAIPLAVEPTAPPGSSHAAEVALWFPQWFQDSFSNARGSLAAITMPHSHTSVSAHASGVTLLAAHSNPGTAACCAPPQSQPASRGTSPQPPTTSPQPLQTTQPVSIAASAGGSSRGASPSPQPPPSNIHSHPEAPGALATPQHHPVSTSHAHNKAQSTALQIPYDAERAQHANTSTGDVGEITYHAATTVGPNVPNAAPTTTTDPNKCSQHEQPHLHVHRHHDTVMQHAEHCQSVVGQLLHLSTPEAPSWVPPATSTSPSNMPGHAVDAAVPGAPHGEALQNPPPAQGGPAQQSTLRTYERCYAPAPQSVYPSLKVPESSGNRSGHELQERSLCGVSRAASPSLRHLPETCPHACSAATTTSAAMPPEQFQREHACGLLEGPNACDAPSLATTESCATQIRQPQGKHAAGHHLGHVGAVSLPDTWQQTQGETAYCCGSPAPSMQPMHGHSVLHHLHPVTLANAAALAAEQHLICPVQPSFTVTSSASIHDAHSSRPGSRTGSRGGPAVWAAPAHQPQKGARFLPMIFSGALQLLSHYSLPELS